MPLIGTGEPVQKLYEPDLKAKIKIKDGKSLDQNTNYSKEHVQPKLETVKQICEDELLTEFSARFFSIAKTVADEVLNYLEEQQLIDRASIKSNSNLEAQMMNIVLDGYALSLLHKRLDGKPYEDGGELFVKNSYFFSVQEIAKSLYQVYGKPWEEILTTTQTFQPGECQSKEKPKPPVSIKPLKLIQHLVYSGFYFGMITHYGL